MRTLLVVALLAGCATTQERSPAELERCRQTLAPGPYVNAAWNLTPAEKQEYDSCFAALATPSTPKETGGWCEDRIAFLDQLRARRGECAGQGRSGGRRQAGTEEPSTGWRILQALLAGSEARNRAILSQPDPPKPIRCTTRRISDQQSETVCKESPY